MKAVGCAKIQQLIRHHQDGAIERELERQHWLSAPSFAAAVDRAAMSITARRKLHAHQRRNGKSACILAARRLKQHITALRRARDFEALHRAVVSSLSLAPRIDRIGELYCYDVAHRIGMWCGFAPKVVYLHAGTRRGARKLGIVGWNLPALALAGLPCGLADLEPEDAEDILCHFSGGREVADCSAGRRAKSFDCS